MDRIELNGVWYIKESLTLQNESYQNDYSVTNLNVITYRNGDAIPKVKDPKKWSELTTGAYCYYDNDSSKGILYNWYAVNDPRDLAPVGWHIPTAEEAKTLVDFLSSPSTSTETQTNSSFYVNCCSLRNWTSGYDDFDLTGSCAHWWSSSRSNMNGTQYPVYYTFYNPGPWMGSDNFGPGEAAGMAVRLIKD